MEIKNRTLSNFAELVRTGECKKFRGRLKVGVEHHAKGGALLPDDIAAAAAVRAGLGAAAGGAAAAMALRALLLAGMVSTHRLASWEFHCFSTASAAFHKVLRSAYDRGAFAGSKISLWTIPRFSG